MIGAHNHRSAIGTQASLVLMCNPPGVRDGVLGLRQGLGCIANVGGQLHRGAQVRLGLDGILDTQDWLP